MNKPIVAIAALLLCAVSTAFAAEPPPPEAYGRLPAIDDVALSPDAQVVAYIADADGKRRLVIQTVDGKPLFSIGVDGQKVRDLRFFDAKHLIITTSAATKMEGYAATYEWYNARSLNYEKRTLATLMGVSSQSSSNTVLGVSFLTIGKRDMLVAEGLTKDGGSTAQFFVDPDTGVSRLFSDRFGVFDDNGRSVAWAEYYGGDGDRWRLVTTPPKGPGVRELFALEHARLDQPGLYGYGRDREHLLLVVTEEDEHAFYEVAIADGSKRKLSFATGGAGVAPLYDDRSQALLGFAMQGETTTELEAYDPALKALWAAAKAEFPNAAVSIADLTPDRKAALLLVQGPRDAGSYYLVDTGRGVVSRIGALYPAVPDAAVSERRMIHYKAADGLDIPAFLTLPNGRDPKKLPLIVMPHGGPGSRDDAGFDWWAQAMAARGYAVLQPQFRGSAGFGLAFQRAGYGEWGKKMQTDLSDGVRRLAADGTIDPARVCIVGASYGGYAAMAGPALDRGVYRCAVSYAGVSDLKKMLATEKRDSGGSDTTTVRFWKRYMGAQSLNDAALDAISPARLADRFDAPILLIHGKDDTVVRFEQSQVLADALKRAGKPVELIALPGEDHWLSGGDTRLAMLKATIAFVERHNPPQ